MHVSSREILTFVSLFFFEYPFTQAQVTSIVTENEGQWYYLHPTDGVDPTTSSSDPDFHLTWFHQNLSNYSGGSYDGPSFIPDGIAPFSYGAVDGIASGTLLEIPPVGSRFSSYFLRVIDGGTNGYHSLQIEILGDDGAFVYLNGTLIALDNVSNPDIYKTLSDGIGNETSFDALTLINEPVLNPGPNLLALSIHNTSPFSSDLGFAIRIRGIDASNPLPTILINESDSNWAYLNNLDDKNNGIDPDSFDVDFDSTWYDQSLGSYIGSTLYNGPLFTPNGTAPFEYGGIDGIESGTTLITPNEGTRGTVYFLYEFDGGLIGYSNLNLTLLADDGAFVYLNGKLIAVENLSQSSPDTWRLLARRSNSETDFSILPFTGSTTPVVKPGPNLLAVSVHQATTTSSDLGFKLKLTGIEGLPDIGAVYSRNTTHNSTDITWCTGQAGDSAIQYGFSPESLNQSKSIPGSRTNHKVTLSDLVPNTTYYYEVSTTDGDSFTTSEPGTFKTGFDPDTIILIRGPYLQAASYDRITVKWRTSNPGDSKVYFGSTIEALNQSVTVPGSRTDHEVTLNNLTANTIYFYKVESKNEAGVSGGSLADSNHFFKTSPTSGTPSPTRIWIIGDSGTANSNAKAVYDGFRSFNGLDHTDVWLMLGDNAYQDGTDQEYQNAVFETYPELLHNTHLWPTFGNHDSHASLGEPYFNIFNLPTGGECGGVASGTESYYSFNYGNIHFICLDSQTSSNYSDELGGTGMSDWLLTDLEAATEDWIIAFFHHGPYTKGSHDSDTETHHVTMRNNLLPILEDYGVDLILSGHSHAYERSYLINGHYGLSTSYDEAIHVIDTGNGSNTGTIDFAGNFVLTGGDGAYQKPLAAGNLGQVSTIVGSSGKLSRWDNGSRAVVNPNPHPVFIANLRLLGSMIIDVEDYTLHGVFIDGNGAVRDDFTILKGSNVTSIVTDERMAEGETNPDTTLKIIRNGAIELPLVVDYTIGGSASPSDYNPALTGSLTYKPGEKTKTLTLSIVNDSIAEGPEMLTFTLSEHPVKITETSAERRTYRLLNPGLAVIYLDDLSSQSWWFRNFGSTSLTPELWKLDHDHDGHDALTEYGLNGDPNFIDHLTITPKIKTAGGILEFEYTRDNSKPDIQYQVLSSTDLSNWTTTGVIDRVDGTLNDAGLEKHRASIPISGSRQFLQLEILLP